MRNQHECSNFSTTFSLNYIIGGFLGGLIGGAAFSAMLLMLRVIPITSNYGYQSASMKILISDLIVSGLVGIIFGLLAGLILNLYIKRS